MPKTIKEERLRWILPIFNKEIGLNDAVKVCPHSKRILERRLASFRKCGEIGLTPKPTRPKSNLRETPKRIKERIIELKKENDICSKKTSWKLKKEGILLRENTIQKIIKKEGLVRKYRVRKLKYKYVKIPLTPGGLVEIDVKHMPNFDGK